MLSFCSVDFLDDADQFLARLFADVAQTVDERDQLTPSVVLKQGIRHLREFSKGNSIYHPQFNWITQSRNNVCRLQMVISLTVIGRLHEAGGI